jgi:hypothetical protein
LIEIVLKKLDETALDALQGAAPLLLGVERTELLSSSSAQLEGCLTDCRDLVSAGWAGFRAGDGGTGSRDGWM